MNQSPFISPEAARANMIDELGISGLDPQIQNDILSGVIDALSEQIAIALYSHIPTEHHAEIDVLMDAGDMDGARAKIIAFVPNAAEIADSVTKVSLAEFKVDAQKHIEEIIAAGNKTA